MGLREFHSAMFFRMLIRAAILRLGRASAALLAMVVAATVTTAMLNLFVDVQAKLRKEFRNYGANIVVTAKDGQSLPADSLARTESAIAGHGSVAPFAYAIATTLTGQPVVVSGTNFVSVRKIDSWWLVTAWPKNRDDALMGARAAAALNSDGKPFDLAFHGHTIRLNPIGTLHTGASEDSRIYISLSDFENWTGLQPTSVEVAVSGSAADVDAMIGTLRRAVASSDVRGIRPVMEAEARVLGKTRATLFASCIVIIATAALCVLATLTGWVLDRRRDFALMKALGASQQFISVFFAAEAAFLACVGAALGFGIGIGVAAWIGRANFHAAVMPRFDLFPLVLGGCILVATASALLPMSLLRRLQPAMILKGE